MKHHIDIYRESVEHMALVDEINALKKYHLSILDNQLKELNIYKYGTPRYSENYEENQIAKKGYEILRKSLIEDLKEQRELIANEK